MPNALTNFIVGLGMDTSEFDRGEKKVQTGIMSMRSKTLMLGAAAGAATGMIGKMALEYAQATTKLSQHEDVFGVRVEDLRAYGQALEEEGGSVESFMAQMERLERMRQMTPAQVGSLFAEAGIRGVDPSVVLNTENAVQAYRNLSDVISNLPRDKRLPVADVFGLDEASIRFLSKGRAEIDQIIERQKAILPITQQNIEDSRELNKEWVELNHNVKAVGETFSSYFVKPTADVVEALNDIFDIFRESGSEGLAVAVNQNFKETKEETQRNFTFGMGTTANEAQIQRVQQAQVEALVSGDSGTMPTNMANREAEARVQAMTQFNQRQPVQVNMTIENTMELDGQVLDRRIDTRTEQHYSESLEDLTSSNQG
jgi:hypothetical protein